MPESDFTGTVFICHDYPSGLSAGIELIMFALLKKLLKTLDFSFAYEQMIC